MLIAHASAHPDLLEPAFVHAVALAAGSVASVASIHVAAHPEPEAALPAASTLLRRWGMASSLEHRWIQPQPIDDTTETLLDSLAALRPDLLVASTHARTGLLRLLAGSIAEGVARNSGIPTLLLPLDAPGLVNLETGVVDLRRILLVAGTDDEARRELEAFAVLKKLARLAHSEVELLHVVDGSAPPNVRTPAGIRVVARAAVGPREAAVERAVQDHEASLVVMASRGHDRVADVVWASHTERVLHRVRCPLLWVPLGASAIVAQRSDGSNAPG
jgi:nucleotide-binding universal stress UspA family protein